MKLHNPMTYCNDCKFFKHFRMGGEDYPINTYISYCEKGHWNNGDFSRIENDMSNYCIERKEINLDNIYDNR